MVNKKNLEEKIKIDRICWCVVQGLILLYGLSMCYLFYKQTQWVDGSVYESDLPAHIKMIVEDGWYYSLTAFVYQLCYMLPFGNQAIALFLATCGVLSVYMTGAVLRYTNMLEGLNIGVLEHKEQKVTEHLLADEAVISKAFYLLVALGLNLVMPCYVKGMADGRYIGMQSASIWHNSTYIVMKVVALVCILLYMRLEESYAQGIKLTDWCIFAGVLGICTAVKPSFFMIFAPMMAIFLVIDLLKGVLFKRVFLFGMTVFPSLAVIVFQNMILFGNETGNGWEIRPGYALSLHSGHPVMAAALSIWFPLIVLLLHFSDLKSDRWYLGTWMMAFFGFLEVFLFSENGTRASDGNFMWGYSFAILMIFGSSILKWMQDLIVVEKRKAIKKCFTILAGVILLWHLYCGLYFYTQLVRGVSYWMWG